MVSVISVQEYDERDSLVSRTLRVILQEENENRHFVNINIWLRNHLVKRSITNLRSLFSESNRNSYLSLVLFERQQIITLHHVGCQNKCHLVVHVRYPSPFGFVRC